MIDNIVYASLNDLYDVQIEMMQENGNTQWEIIGFEWWPIEQKFYVEPMDGFYWEFQYQAGDTTYYWGKWSSIHPISVSLYAFFMENLWFQFATFPIKGGAAGRLASCLGWGNPNPDCSYVLLQWMGNDFVNLFYITGWPFWLPPFL